LDKISQEFEEQGYSVLSNLLSSEEIDRIFGQVEEVLDVVLDSTDAEFPEAASVDEKYLWLDRHRPQLKSHAYDIFGLLDSVRSIVVKPLLLNVGQKLFNCPLLIDQVQIRADSNRNDRVLPLHQELGQISLVNMTTWIPLVDIGENSGGIAVLPGSHRRGRVPHRYFPELNNYHGIVETEYDLDELKPLQLQRGDAVVFHPHLFHGSRPNISSDIRWTLVSRFNNLSEAAYLKDEEASLHLSQHTDVDE